MKDKILDKLTPIGLAGCGRMGAPMARALINSGHNVSLLDVLSPNTFGDLGPFMTDAKTLANTSKILIAVVRDEIQIEELLFSTQSLIRRRPLAIKTVIICSTISPRFLQSLRKRIPSSIKLIDAPMSGAAISAENCSLSFMIGGAAEDLKHLKPLLEVMGTKIHHMGPFGSGMTAKVLNNFCTASSMAATRMVLRWAQQLGVSERDLLAVINDSSGQNWLASNFDEIEFSRAGFSSDNTVGILYKDLRSMLDVLPEHEHKGLPESLLEAINKLEPMP